MADIVKKCPICGNDPLALVYTSYPAKYGYQHCDIHAGYNKDWHEAKAAWNKAVDDYLKDGD